MRLIDADNLREEWLINGLNENIYCTNDFLASIDVEDTIDAAPVVHARWIVDVKIEDSGACGCYCSNCYNKEFIQKSGRIPYCWYCGAKMDEGGKVYE